MTAFIDFFIQIASLIKVIAWILVLLTIVGILAKIFKKIGGDEAFNKEEDVNFASSEQCKRSKAFRMHPTTSFTRMVSRKKSKATKEVIPAVCVLEFNVMSGKRAALKFKKATL